MEVELTVYFGKEPSSWMLVMLVWMVLRLHESINHSPRSVGMIKCKILITRYSYEHPGAPRIFSHVSDTFRDWPKSI